MWRGGAIGGSLTKVADTSSVFIKYQSYSSMAQRQDQSPILGKVPKQAEWVLKRDI